ncbi:MAG: FliH/SctL family protein [Planctomycetota bacterium]
MATYSVQFDARLNRVQVESTGALGAVDLAAEAAKVESARILDLLESIQHQVKQVHDESNTHQREITDSLLAISKKLCEVLIGQAPELVDLRLSELIGEAIQFEPAPVAVKINPEDLQRLSTEDFPFEVPDGLLVGDPSVAPGECRAEFDGFLRASDIWRRLDGIVSRVGGTE